MSATQIGLKTVHTQAEDSKRWGLVLEKVEVLDEGPGMKLRFYPPLFSVLEKIFNAIYLR